MSDYDWNKLFGDNVKVSMGPNTIEKGGILAWRLLSFRDNQTYAESLVSHEKWYNDSWHENECHVFPKELQDILDNSIMRLMNLEISEREHHANCERILFHFQQSMKPKNVVHKFHHSCGFYSFSDLKRCQQELVTSHTNHMYSLYSLLGYPNAAKDAIIPVLISGTVIPHEDGFRSSKMRLLNGTYPFQMSYEDAVKKAKHFGATEWHNFSK